MSDVLYVHINLSGCSHSVSLYYLFSAVEKQLPFLRKFMYETRIPAYVHGTVYCPTHKRTADPLYVKPRPWHKNDGGRKRDAPSLLRPV